MKSHFDSIDDNKEILIVPRKGDKDAIVIMTLSEYNSIVETDYLLSTEANRQQIEKSLQELDSGKTTDLILK